MFDMGIFKLESLLIECLCIAFVLRSELLQVARVWG